MEKIISEIINDKFSKGIILLSTSNLKFDLQAKLGYEISKSVIAKNLKKNKALLPINSNQFIKAKEIRKEIGFDEYIIY